MLRAALVGALSLVVVPACGSKSDAPAAQPGAVAGKVLEVTGTVKVGAVPLAVGSTVKTDDVIETGTDGSVVIELAHNQARWELGPNNKKKPTESLAWTAAKAEGSAALTAEQTSAAGRPAERSAADGTSSAAKEGPPAAQVASAAPTAQPTAPAAAPPPTHMSHTPPPAPKAPSPEGGRAGDELRGASRTYTTPTAPGAASASVDEDVRRSGQAPEPQKNKADPLKSLASCLPAGSSLTLKIHVANHIATVSFVGAADSTVQACINTSVKKLQLADGDSQVSLTR